MPPPSLAALTSTRYAIVIDAGSSGSRLQIYSWLDPEAEREQVIADVRERLLSQNTPSSSSDRSKTKGKGKASASSMPSGVSLLSEVEIEKEVEKSLRRLVKVGKGVEGDDWVKKVEPGISTITPATVPAYLTPLLAHAVSQIPPSQHSSTPIYLFATAGMRLLPTAESDAILDAVCEVLSGDWPFSVRSKFERDGLGMSGKGKGTATARDMCGDNVRIISGEEEGLWGWVAVNYLMDGFGYAPAAAPTLGDDDVLLPLSPLESAEKDSGIGLEKTVPATLVDPKQRSPTFGFLDMGGASTQIAFAPTLEEIEKSQFPTSELRSVSLRLLSGEVVEWPLFVASWLGFGTNRVRERYVESKVEQWRTQLDTLSSTLSLKKDSPTGLPSAKAASRLSAELSRPIDDPCLPQGLILNTESLPSAPKFKGTGDFGQCLAELQPLLQADLPCPAPHNHCLFAGLPTPHIDFEREDQRGFIGISEYWYTAQQVLGVGGVWDWGEWERGMNAFCARDWQAIEQEFVKDGGGNQWMGSAIELSRLEMQCFKGGWISNVLHEGIGIPRLYDFGGNETLTGGSGVGETNEEAERRAREKGLMSGTKRNKKKPSHFQSLDKVGETAVSWTLGKMIIEASKAVHNHGYLDRSVGISRTWWNRDHWLAGKAKAGAGLAKVHSALSVKGLPHGTLEVLLLATAVFAILLLLRRRLRFRGMPSLTHRRRKASDAGWLQPTGLLSDSSSDEEWQSTSGGKRVISLASRLRLWRKRCTSLARNILGTTERRPRLPRQYSAPAALDLALTPRGPSYTSATNLSLPASPRIDDATFIPAHTHDANAASDFDQTTPRPGDFVNALTNDVPTRSGGRSVSNGNGLLHKKSVGSMRSKRTQPQPLSPSSTIVGGWNDPPIAAFGIYDATSSAEDSLASSVLMLPAGEPTMSRSASRVSLVDYAKGLSSRPHSRTSMHADE